MKEYLMTREEYDNEIRRIVITEILTWNCEDIRDLMKSIIKIYDLADKMEDENAVSYAVEIICDTVPPSFILIEQIESLYTIEELNRCYTLYAVDKNLNCCLIEDYDEVYNLNDVLDWFVKGGFYTDGSEETIKMQEALNKEYSQNLDDWL